MSYRNALMNAIAGHLGYEPKDRRKKIDSLMQRAKSNKWLSDMTGESTFSTESGQYEMLGDRTAPKEDSFDKYKYGLLDGVSPGIKEAFSGAVYEEAQPGVFMSMDSTPVLEPEDFQPLDVTDDELRYFIKNTRKRRDPRLGPDFEE